MQVDGIKDRGLHKRWAMKWRTDVCICYCSVLALQDLKELSLAAPTLDATWFPLFCSPLPEHMEKVFQVLLVGATTSCLMKVQGSCPVVFVFVCVVLQVGKPRIAGDVTQSRCQLK
eukprot:4562921-Amphidinium_carterae.1